MPTWAVDADADAKGIDASSIQTVSASMPLTARIEQRVFRFFSLNTCHCLLWEVCYLTVLMASFFLLY